ncbi:MAG: NAD(P)H-hydrate epimerase [Flavonifractor plautii]
MRIATAEQMRTLDRRAIEERGVPSLELMERAANALAEAAIDTAANAPGRAVCFCGPGNNGGDGVACARLLLEAGFEVRCILVGQREKLTCDTRAMEARLAAAGGVLEPFTPDDPDFAAWCLKADVMVDAIFGIGLNTEVRGDTLTAVHMMNTCDIPVVSADIPSGVEADTGRVLGEAVHAARTVTFTLPKAGHYVGKGGLCTGVLTVADIGIPRDLVDGEDYPVQTVEGADVRLPVRPRDAHKGDFGKVYLLGGSVGYTGAPVFAAQAAVRSGAGLVTVGVPAPVWPIAAAKLDEAMPHPLPAGKEGQLSLEAGEAAMTRLAGCGVCLIGPGLGRGNGVAAVVRHLLGEIHLPVVLDADGINALEDI